MQKYSYYINNENQISNGNGEAAIKMALMRLTREGKLDRIARGIP